MCAFRESSFSLGNMYINAESSFSLGNLYKTRRRVDASTRRGRGGGLALAAGKIFGAGNNAILYIWDQNSTSAEPLAADRIARAGLTMVTVDTGLTCMHTYNCVCRQNVGVSPSVMVRGSVLRFCMHRQGRRYGAGVECRWRRAHVGEGVSWAGGRQQSRRAEW